MTTNLVNFSSNSNEVFSYQNILSFDESDLISDYQPNYFPESITPCGPGINQNIDSNMNQRSTEIISDNSNSNSNLNDSPMVVEIKLTEKKRKRKKHDKFSKDNIERKLYTHYFKFLVELINKLIKEIIRINYTDVDIKGKTFSQNFQFRRLSYNNFLKNICEKSFKKLKTESIKEIFIKNASTKYKDCDNNKIYNNIIKQNKKFEKILEEPCLKFFGIFYGNKTDFNISEYNFNINNNINLSDIKGYRDFINKQKFETKEQKDIYIKEIENCIKKYFLNCSKTNFFKVKKIKKE